MTKLQIYQMVHVISVVLLVALAFSAFAAPAPGRKRRIAISSGVVAVVALVSGFGMISSVYGNQFAPWMFVKIGAWLGIAALAVMVFRKPQNAGIFMLLTALLAGAAVYAVYVMRLGV